MTVKLSSKLKNIPLIVGLTGLIGSGKSTVSDMFTKLDVPIIDTDQIAHQLTNSKAVINTLTDLFGAEISTIQGKLDRNKLRKIVLDSDIKRQQLEQYLHPLIFAETTKQIECFIKGANHPLYCIVVIPLLFKSPEYLTYIDRILFVDCEEDIAINRAMARGNITMVEIKTLMALQVPRIEQLRLSNDVLYNNGSLSQLRMQVTKLNKKYECYSEN